MTISRRGFVLGFSALLAGCSTQYSQQVRAYGARPDEKFPLRAIQLSRIPPQFRRTEVAYDPKYKPGTIVVDTPARRLYYVEAPGKAIRYAVSVGKEGKQLRGNAYVGRKAEWPSWTPTQHMMEVDPRNRQYAAGVPGGPNNPLGARALYLYRNGHDLNFRIHGTNQPQSIGYAMSSGCIRMLNQDVIDLYSRAPAGTHVVVLQET